MKSYYGNYLGMVINNNDPEFRGRIQVFVPHIMPTIYEGWNKEGENITINCVGDNMSQGLSSKIIAKLRKILPWADAASPIVGQGISGGMVTADENASGSTSIDSNGNIIQNLNLDQTPTAAPAGSSSPGEACIIPAEAGVNIRDLKPGFVQRLNGLYQEASTLGYKIVCSSGYRSTEKQSALYQGMLTRTGGKSDGSVARPGSSTHELGIAVDLKVTGNGVSITQIKVAAERTGVNKDTPQWRDLLAKYGLHQPLHPILVPQPSAPESWHVEPIETPKAFKGDRVTVPKSVAQKLSSTSKSIGETTSSSQFPAISNPLEHKDAVNPDGAQPIAPKTNQTTITSGPNTGSTASGTAVDSQLAKDRTDYFRAELNDPQLLDRLEYLMKREGGQSGNLILETACNRAMFGNKTLKQVVFKKAYYHSSKDPNATNTIPHTSYTTNMIKTVIYGGSNVTDLATDQAYNDENLFAKRFIDAGVQGSWFNLLTGKKITDSARVTKLSTTPGTGNEEFIYQKSGSGPNGSSDEGRRAKAYGLKYNVKPTDPSTFMSGVPLPENLAKARSSDLTKEQVGTTEPIAVVKNTDQHGPTIVKNTNDLAKGLFAFPGVGAMVWIFFREGNPLFPVYFAASYSSGEWKSAYNTSGIDAEGGNVGTVGTQASNSMRLNPNAGGGLEFTHIKDASDPSGAHDKAVAMIYGDDGSNMVFSKGYHQIYSRHDRRDQIDGHSYSIVNGAEERWIDDDSNVNIRGNVHINIGKIDAESMDAMKELSDFSKQMNEILMTNSSQ